MRPAACAAKRSLYGSRPLSSSASRTMASTPRLSASVVLLRPSARKQKQNFEVLMLKRSPRLNSFASFHVFPGGVVDKADGGLVMTALRELFEETGILLCDGGKGGLRSSAHRFASSVDSQALQKSVSDDASTFSTVYESRGKIPASSSLVDFCQFLTPVFEKRRYLAHFFLTFIENDADVHISQDESSSFLWISPTEAIEQNAQGKLDMLPPQYYILTLLSQLDSMSALEASVPMHGAPIQPHPVEMNKKRLILAYPGDEDYPSTSDAAPGNRHRLRCTLPMGSGGFEIEKNISDEQARGAAAADMTRSRL